MKITLKQFVKKNCSAQNQVLCSYFIKTYLFWKFETTDLNFWRDDNLRECIMYLVTQFAHCLHDGVLPHYFIPSFNLLSVKLTPEAQLELLQLFEIIIQYDIKILKECETLKTVWSKLLSAEENQIQIIHNVQKTNLERKDKIMAKYLCLFDGFACDLDGLVLRRKLCKWLQAEFCMDISDNLFTPCNLVLQPSLSLDPRITKILTLPCKTQQKSLFIKQLLLKKCIKSLMEPSSGNKSLYQLHRIAHNESESFDISTSKLWYAIVLLKKQDYTSALDIINQVSSSIPPYALSFSICDCGCTGRTAEAGHLYVDTFINSGSTITERARQAWLMPFYFKNCMNDILPLGIQIELYFNNFWTPVLTVPVSPFVMLYFLSFQCYHELGQYANRDNALRQLIEVVTNNDNNIPCYHEYNIAGHCLLIAGEIHRARKMFDKKKKFDNRKYALRGKYLSSYYV